MRASPGLTRRSSHRSLLVPMALALGALAACTKKDAASDTAAVVAPETGAAVAPTATGTGSMAATNAPTDPQIAHVAVTANAIDSTAGVMAQQKGQSKAVKDFAKMMVTDHAAVNKRAVALATKLGVTPEDNDISRGLQQGASASRDSLSSMSGANFDKAYIAHEVAYHQAVLDALDNTLIPNSQNAELKALLTEVRPAIAAHLEKAKGVQKGLGGA